jgi:hypothetical protein
VQRKIRGTDRVPILRGGLVRVSSPRSVRRGGWPARLGRKYVGRCRAAEGTLVTHRRPLL